VAGADRKSGGMWCILLCPMLNQQRRRTCSPTGCADIHSPWKRKSEKAWLRRGTTLLVTTPRRLLNHLMKTESLLLLLRHKGGLEWLVLDKVDRLLDVGSLGGLVEQIFQQLCG